MEIDRDLVLQIAKLANLELSDAEVTLFTNQLADILTYIEKLKEVDDIAEPFSVRDHTGAQLRPDVIVPSLPVEKALQNAPERAKRFFKVPRVLP